MYEKFQKLNCNKNTLKSLYLKVMLNYFIWSVRLKASSIEVVELKLPLKWDISEHHVLKITKIRWDKQFFSILSCVDS